MGTAPRRSFADCGSATCARSVGVRQRTPCYNAVGCKLRLSRGRAVTGAASVASLPSGWTDRPFIWGNRFDWSPEHLRFA